MNIEFPLLQPNDIEVRVQSVSQGKGFSLLLYKTARVDANILDNHKDIGCFNWKKSFYELKGNIYCSLSIYDSEKKEWVSKDDCGKESQTESEKGEASDSFKRAGFAWGIGRELYTAPFIWVKESEKNTSRGRYSVKSITYTSTKPYEIKTLEIANESGEIVYSYGLRKTYQETQDKPNYKQKLKDFLDNLQPENKASWLNWIKTKATTDNIDILSNDACFTLLSVIKKASSK